MTSVPSLFGFGAASLARQISRTYFLLRFGLAASAFALPVYLALRGLLFDAIELQDSLSAYYYAGDGALRDEFVGALCAVGCFLLVYKGFSTYEDWALNIAGVALVGVALFPMGWDCTGPCGVKAVLHTVFALTFFAGIAYVGFFRSPDTLIEGLVESPDSIRSYRRRYRGLSVGMAGFVVAAVVLALADRLRDFTFYVETAGVWAFGAYWLLKTLEIERSNADVRASTNQLRTGSYEGQKFFHQVPLEVVTEESSA